MSETGRTLQKAILLTAATDGIGLATATMLVSQGHRVLLHGRNPAKLGVSFELRLRSMR